ncbi:hypothetical protein SEA_KNOCKER_65 [Mycobacterium phage Knocker]|nr:hypothetical protein SEA_KNOCKER_65 [Mycobacterium phage Knocker]
MTATTRGRTRAPKQIPAKNMDITLVEFGDEIDDHLGRAVGFADAVREWRTQTDIARALDSKADHRRVIHERLDRFITSGNGVVDGRRIEAVRTGGGPRVVLRSAVVEKAKPDLWFASKVTNRVLAVRHPSAVVPEFPAPRMRTAAEVWAALDRAKKQATAAKKAAAEARAVIDMVLDECAAVWDGTPHLTADGWTVGVQWQVRFNEARCRELAEEQGIDLSNLEAVEPSAGRRVYRLVDPDGGADEIDGE